MNPQQDLRYADVYSALSSDRIIFLCEDVTKEMASSLCGLLLYYDTISSEKDITIFINTHGGDSAALAGIYDIMSLTRSPISTICMGKAYSAGAFILAAGTKGKRYMFKNSEVMIHGLQCSFPGFPGADQTDASNYFKYLESSNNRILKILAKHTGQSLSKIQQDSKRDFYLDAQSAIRYGIADAIIE